MEPLEPNEAECKKMWEMGTYSVLWDLKRHIQSLEEAFSRLYHDVKGGWHEWNPPPWKF